MYYEVTGDMVGGGTTTINTTITGLKGKQLPQLTQGALIYTGTDWVFGASGGGELSGSEIAITDTATGNIGRFHRCTGNNTDYTVTLPALSGNAGKQICFIMDSSLTKLVTIKGSGSELIDGQNTRIMWSGESCILRVNDACNMWEKIGGKSIPMCANIYSSNSQSMSSGVTTKILYNAILYDIGTIVRLSNNDIFIKRPGVYAMDCQVRVDCAALTQVTTSLVSSSQGNLVDSETRGVNPSSNCSTNRYLTASEYIYVLGSQWVGTTRDVYAGPSLTFLAVSELPTW